VARLDARRWPLPPVFDWLARAGRLQRAELARTFNAGLGLVLVVDPDKLADVRSALESLGETVFEVGRIEPGAGPPRVLLDGVEAAWPGVPPRS
jgi:phosphoribosylformylglycinamidine cyclo-ligase